MRSLNSPETLPEQAARTGVDLAQSRRRHSIRIAIDLDRSLRTPAPVQPVVDRTVNQAGIGTVQEAFREAETESPPGEPFERWQHHFEKLAHAKALRGYEAVDYADHESNAGKEAQCPSDQSCV